MFLNVVVTLSLNPLNFLIAQLTPFFIGLTMLSFVLFQTRLAMSRTPVNIFVVLFFKFVNRCLTKSTIPFITVLKNESIAFQILEIIFLIAVVIVVIVLLIDVKRFLTKSTIHFITVENTLRMPVHILLIGLLNNFIKLVTPFNSFPKNDSWTKFQTNSIAPEKICLTPSHSFEKSPVNNPENVFTNPMITFKPPFITPLMFSHTILTTASTALKVKSNMPLISGSVNLTAPNAASSTGLTTFHMPPNTFEKACRKLDPSLSQNDFISEIFSLKKPTIAPMALETRSRIVLKAFLIPSTIDNTDSLVVKNSLIPDTAFRNASFNLFTVPRNVSDF